MTEPQNQDTVSLSTGEIARTGRSPLTTVLKNVGMILGSSIFIAALSKIAVPLPFSPVPVTGQTLGVLLTGIVLGSRRGTASVLTYLALGIAGIPVFALGAGPAYLTGPTGGYLAGFVIAAFIAGFISERSWGRNPFATVLALVSGSIAVYACGLLWLSRFVGMPRVLSLGLCPFVPGDITKMVIALVLVQAGWKTVRKVSK